MVNGAWSTTAWKRRTTSRKRGEAFSVYDLDDEDREKPIAFHVDQDTAEALTRAHFKTIAGKLGLREIEHDYARQFARGGCQSP